MRGFLPNITRAIDAAQSAGTFLPTALIQLSRQEGKYIMGSEYTSPKTLEEAEKNIRRAKRDLDRALNAIQDARKSSRKANLTAIDGGAE